MAPHPFSVLPLRLRLTWHPGVLTLLVIGLLLTFQAARKVDEWVGQESRAAFEHEARQRTQLLQQRLGLYSEALRGLQGFFVQQQVTRDEFRAYVDRLRLTERHRGVSDFRFARRLTRSELPAWRQRVSRELLQRDGIQPRFPALDESRGEHLLVEMIHPLQEGLDFIGLDLLASPAYREALAAIRQSLAPALSRRVEEYREPTYALLAAVPGRSDNDFPGTVALFFRPADLLREFDDGRGLDFELYDAPVASPNFATLIYDSNAAHHSPTHALSGFHFQTRLPLYIGGREWALVITALPKWRASRGEYWLPKAVALVGLLATLFLAWLLDRLIGRRRRAETALANREAEYKRLVESLPLVIYERSCDGRFLYLSPQAEELLGRPSEHWLADPSSFFTQCSENDRESLKRHLQAACEKGEVFELEYRFRTPRGTQHWMRDTGRAWRDTHGMMTIHGTLEDVTRRKQSEEALQNLNAMLETRIAERTADLAATNARLEELAQAKQDFLATMSHEIRTPLTGLMGMLELLALTHLDDEQRHEVVVAREAGRTLTRIIDDILDFSKIEAGRLELALQPESLRHLIEGVRDAFLPLASAKGLSLICTIDPRLPDLLVMDAMRVAQILNNYVSNAVKFTSRGYVELRAECRGEDGESVEIDFLVRDTGIGLEPETCARIFDRYAQADAQVARRYGGSGLGLAICKRLAELMGGSVAVESAPGQGSTFHVLLRLPRAPEGAESERKEIAGVSPVLDSGGKPLLVVDDHPTNRMLMARQLALLELPAELAENGQQALAKWKTGDYALVITDCHMPLMDGFELTQQIRRLEEESGRRHTPLIAWTAAALPDEIARCKAIGMDDVLIKPADLDGLRRVLARWLPTRTGRDTTAPAGTAVLERQVLAALAGSTDEERQILDDFVRHTEADLGELEQYLAAGDLASASQQAHRIKGAARMIGAVTLAARALRAEEAAQAGDATLLKQRCTELRADLAEIEAQAGIALAAPAPAASDGEPVWDEEALAAMAGDSPELQNELLDRFFTAGHALHRKMQDAYERGDIHALARLAHKFQSAARSIGARQLAAVCQEIEAAGNNGDWLMTTHVWRRMTQAWNHLAQRLGLASRE